MEVFHSSSWRLLILSIARLGVGWLIGLAPLAFVGCESGLGVPLDATGRVARGLGLPQGLRSVVLVRYSPPCG